MFARIAGHGFVVPLAAFMTAFVTYWPEVLSKTTEAEANDMAALSSEVAVDRPLILRGDETPLFVLLRFDAAERVHHPLPQRPQVNLGLVLDRSGSMADAGKIDYLKKAAAMVVDRLSPRDYLAVVEYDDAITLMWPSQPVESAYPIQQLIHALEPRGSTNLVGGMMRGADEVLARRAHLQGENVIHRVLLMSDGLANQGVTDPREIARLVRSVKGDGVRISAIGLGRDYDEDLMQAIAENGGGNYYYVEHPTQMARIFEHELETLFTTVAKDVELHYHASPLIKGFDVISLDDSRAIADGRVELDNFYAGESRALILRIEPAEGAFDDSGTDMDLGRFELSYTDIATGQVAVIETSLLVAVSDDPAAVAAARNHDVVVEAELVDAERRHSAAIKHYESGNFEMADQLMAELEGDIVTRNDALKDARLAQKLEAVQVEREQMTAAASADADERSAYLKSSKQRLYQAQMGKRALYALQVGDKGLEVERLQEALASAGYYAGPVDGVYSEDVGRAVEAYQADQSLGVDGVAGPATMQSLGLY